MLPLYLTLKSLHVSLALVSGALFALRALWSVTGSSWLKRPWVRVLPHLLDTLLLAAGLSLMVLTTQWPHQTPWLAAKLTALLAYIGFGSLAIRRGASVRTRALSACLALLIFVYMLGAAHRHSVLSWLV